MSQTTIEHMASAMYDDNLRQLNAIEASRAERQGYLPMVMIQRPFDQAEDHVRAVYLSLARVAFDIVSAHQSESSK